ncbi:hypothetical protein GALMADRAFT_862795 [Galerina marginata CBS 339.88]|uniref:Uncharacterized protein n=1 Tax=Galerina marginata (strain CBS 339.88) TaxID=685588 RepID=A0A067TSY0_GALM3|nr:hypothetical protein GALMADRAFT_862795 [Galerina marginata CBS 339.88]
MSVLRDGCYIVVASKGRLNMYRTRDHEVNLEATFKLSGSGVSVQAIHASSNSSNHHDIIATASRVDGDESTLTIWMDANHRLKVPKRASMKSGDYSAVQIIPLSILVYILCQLATSLLLPNLTFFSASLVGSVSNFNNGQVNLSPMPVATDRPTITMDLSPITAATDVPRTTMDFPLDSNPGPASKYLNHHVAPLIRGGPARTRLPGLIDPAPHA